MRGGRRVTHAASCQGICQRIHWMFSGWNVMPKNRAIDIRNVLFIMVAAAAVFRGCGTQPAAPLTARPNRPPVAKIGPDVNVTDLDGDGSETVSLSAADSSDPDSGDSIVNYTWKENGQVVGTGPGPT